MQKAYVLPDRLRDALLGYLIKQPYEDVAPFVGAFGNLEEYQPPQDPPPAPDKGQQVSSGANGAKPPANRKTRRATAKKAQTEKGANA